MATAGYMFDCAVRSYLCLLVGGRQRLLLQWGCPGLLVVASLPHQDTVSTLIGCQFLFLGHFFVVCFLFFVLLVFFSFVGGGIRYGMCGWLYASP